MAAERVEKMKQVAGAWWDMASMQAMGAYNFAAGTTVGQELGIGFAESYGFGFEPHGKGVLGSGRGKMFSRGGNYSSSGFLSWQTTPAGRYGRMFGRGFSSNWGTGTFTRVHPIHGQIAAGPPLSGIRGQVLRAAGQKAGQFRAAGHYIRQRGISKGLGFAGKSALGKGMHGLGLAGRALMPVMAVHAMYTGYQEGGVTGAIGGGVRFGLEWGAMRAGVALLGKIGITAGALAPLAIAAGGAYGFYQFGEAAQEYGKQMKKLEMGAPIVDPFGTVATTRQRSLMALNNTHINGRMAMGNEGILMHDGAYRR